MLTDPKARNAKPKKKPYKLSDRDWLYLYVAPSGRDPGVSITGWRGLGRPSLLAAIPIWGLQMLERNWRRLGRWLPRGRAQQVPNKSA